MKKVGFIFGLLLTFFLSSCEKNCNCQQVWIDDCSRIYQSGDLVEHNGKCYKAFAQGKACMVEPGTTEGDIWEICN